MTEDPGPIGAPTRVCRKCSTQTTTSGAFCPNCGTPFDRSSSRRPSRKVLASAVLAVVLIGAIAAGAITKHQHDQNVENAHIADAKASADADAASAAAEADETERSKRSAWVKDLEGYVKKDAKKHVKEGILDGPILSGSCTATGGGSTDDLTALTGTFDCMAVNKEHHDGTMSGYSYAGTIDWQSGEFTWQLGN